MVPISPISPMHVVLVMHEMSFDNIVNIFFLTDQNIDGLLN